ncbi:hypothetical protein D623_10030995 [Myotis brandtii]|uniref:Uncharacterized protein n=1 Tax=Myotis brandtii TaxID=109478 RepID=S7NPB3_MYOBR|nr:hypothetical protein D623_10030995 [Myotis brandtii]
MLNPLGMPGGWSNVGTWPGDCTLAFKVHSDMGNKIRDDLQQAENFTPLANQPKVNRLSAPFPVQRGTCVSPTVVLSSALSTLSLTFSTAPTHCMQKRASISPSPLHLQLCATRLLGPLLD